MVLHASSGQKQLGMHAYDLPTFNGKRVSQCRVHIMQKCNDIVMRALRHPHSMANILSSIQMTVDTHINDDANAGYDSHPSSAVEVEQQMQDTPG